MRIACDFFVLCLGVVLVLYFGRPLLNYTDLFYIPMTTGEKAGFIFGFFLIIYGFRFLIPELINLSSSLVKSK
jgi:hypothetical protein